MTVGSTEAKVRLESVELDSSLNLKRSVDDTKEHSLDLQQQEQQQEQPSFNIKRFSKFHLEYVWERYLIALQWRVVG